MEKIAYDQSQMHALLYQALEAALGSIRVYETAITCTSNDDLQEEWEDHLDEARDHHEVLLELFDDLNLDAEAMTPGRRVVEHICVSLVMAMEMALADGDQEAAQLVAGECVVLAEMKDQLSWDLIGHVCRYGKGGGSKLLQAAHAQVKKDEALHFFHSASWTRELWIESLGLPAVLPPLEELRPTHNGNSVIDEAMRDQLVRELR